MLMLWHSNTPSPVWCFSLSLSVFSLVKKKFGERYHSQRVILRIYFFLIKKMIQTSLFSLFFSFTIFPLLFYHFFFSFSLQYAVFYPCQQANTFSFEKKQWKVWCSQVMFLFEMTLNLSLSPAFSLSLSFTILSQGIHPQFYHLPWFNWKTISWTEHMKRERESSESEGKKHRGTNGEE